MPWICQNCNAEIWSDENMVVLKDELWLKIAQPKDVLCDKCIELKLGRAIKRSDLKPNVMCNAMYIELAGHVLQEKVSFIDKILKEALDTSIENKVLQTITAIKKEFKTPSYEAGDCGIVTIELWKRLNLSSLGFFPFQCFVGYDEHILLMNPKTKDIIDSTVKQFGGNIFSSKDWNGPKYKSFRKLNNAEILDIEKEKVSTLAHRNKKKWQLRKRNQHQSVLL